MSKDEQKLGSFLVKNRKNNFGASGMDHCMDLMCDTTGKDPVTKQNVLELLKYLGKEDIIGKFSEWEMPKFPFSGNLLIDMGLSKGPKFAKIMREIRKKWQESRYTDGQEELLEFAKTIVDDYKQN